MKCVKCYKLADVKRKATSFIVDVNFKEKVKCKRMYFSKKNNKAWPQRGWAEPVEVGGACSNGG